VNPLHDEHSLAVLIQLWQFAEQESHASKPKSKNWVVEQSGKQRKFKTEIACLPCSNGQVSQVELVEQVSQEASQSKQIFAPLQYVFGGGTAEHIPL
jgi:hypothetical protein